MDDDERYVTVRAGDQDLVVTADSAPVTELLPQVQDLLANFAAVRGRATEYLWNFGATGDETGEEKVAFLRDMVPSTLVIAGPGAFELHYEDISESYMLDGYWPAVHLDQDLNPVEVTVEA